MYVHLLYGIKQAGYVGLLTCYPMFARAATWMFGLGAWEVQLSLQHILASFPSATGRGCVSPEYRSHLGLMFIAMFTNYVFYGGCGTALFMGMLYLICLSVSLFTGRELQTQV